MAYIAEDVPTKPKPIRGKIEKLDCLKHISTKDLIEELEGRTGVETVRVDPYDLYKAPEIEGPAIILTVID